MEKSFREKGGKLLPFALGWAVLAFIAMNSMDCFGPRPTWAITRGVRQDAEAKTHLKFPPKAKIRYYEHPMISLDDSVQLKLRMSPEDLDEVLSQPALKEAEWEPVFPFGSRLADDPDWPEWTPSRVKKGWVTQVDLGDLSHLRILVDHTRPEVKEVYLSWFTT